MVPTSVAPITFFVREEAEWMALPSVHSAHEEAGSEIRGLSPSACDVMEFLTAHGASFFVDIVRSTGKLKAEVETGLWELVAAGLVTADGFDNLRALIDPRRRSGQGSGKTNRPRHSCRTLVFAFIRCRVKTAKRQLSQSATCCCNVMAWCSANCWRASAFCRAGVTC